MRWSLQYERLPVYGTEYAIATSHPAASSAGFSVLAQGGNAVDAALAAHAVLCVVEPGMTGLGGDCFALLHHAKTGRTTALNGSGYAPAKLPPMISAADFGSTSPHVVTIPGAVDAWCRLSQDYGTRSLDELFAPAIAMAEEGYPVHQRVAWDWANEAPRLATNPAAARLFLTGGKSPTAGERHAQPELARTLKAIGRYGRVPFYEGEIAEDIVTTLRSLGGAHELQDFAEYQATAHVPISTVFERHQISECPPNGQGVIALLLLNVLQRLLSDHGQADDVSYIELLAEATRAAYEVRDEVLADERFLAERVDSLLSPERAADLIRTMRSGSGAALGRGGNTAYLCVVDRDGNSISFINSLFDAFGSCIVAPKSGVLLNNRGLCFSRKPGHPNASAPRKRPMNTIIPGMIMTERGQPVGPFGIMGGHYQAAGHASFLLNLLVRGMNPQQALNAPRTFATEGVIRAEATLPGSILKELRMKGHEVVVWDRPIGGGQAITRDPSSGVLIAASDPRKDGCALAR